MKSPRYNLCDRTRCGAALIIVLAFVVLLAGLVLAFFSNSLLYRQISNSSASQAKVDLYAQGAVDTIIGDLKQEIAAGSSSVTTYISRNPPRVVGGVVCQPSNAATVVPAQALQGAPPYTVTSFAPNLLKRSAYRQNFFPGMSDPSYLNYNKTSVVTAYLPANGSALNPTSVTFSPSNRAANVSSKTPSQNGRYISPARWNKALLLPKPAGTTSDTNLTPDPMAFVAPDWVLTARDGSNPGRFSTTASFSGAGAVNDPSTSNAGYVVGRYAYTIYDEGGLLDANVAGYPANGIPPYTSGNSDLKANGSKSSLAFADLTQLPGLNALSTTRQQAVINGLVGWRNYASAQVNGGSLSGGYTFTAFPAPSPWPYSLAVRGNASGFLRTSNTALYKGQTDRMLASRQELIRLLSNGIAQDSTERANLQTALQYLTTFSRDVNQPSYIPPTFTDPTNAPTVLQDGTYKDANGNSFGGNSAFGGDKIVNPSFLEKRVSTSFTRNDGATASVGDPLVLRRFALSRLSWITFAGPSAINMSSGSKGYYSVAASITAMGGVANNVNDPVYLFVQQGNAANIYKYFGLTWDSTNHYWVYDHNSVPPPGAPPVPRQAGSGTANIFTLDKITGREPDYFELLKASINVGSLGKHGSLPRPDGADTDLAVSHNDGTLVQYHRDVLVDMQVFQIGANIIDQFDADNYPTRLLVWNPLSTAPATREIAGVENLPYIYRTRAGVVRLQESTSDPASTVDNTKVDKTGAVALFYYPEVWNPHDANSSVVAPNSNISPVADFRVLLNSADPDHYGAESTMDLSQNANDYTQLPYAQVAPPILSTPKAVSDKSASSTTRTPMITFSVPATTPPTLPTLFREPTVLMATNLPNANLACTLDSSEVGTYMSGGGLMATYGPGDNIPNVGTYNAAKLANSFKGPFVGLMMGRAPIKYWNGNATTPAVASIGSLMGYNPSGGYFSMSIRLQYYDAWNNFVTYTERIPPLLDGTDMATLVSGDKQVVEDGFDPRTSRFGMMQQDGGGRAEWVFANPSGTDYRTVTDRSFTDTGTYGNGATGLTNRNSGRGMPQTPQAGGSFYLSGYPAPGWSGDPHGWDGSQYGLNPCLLVQNDPKAIPYGIAAANAMYADPDGVIRRAMGGYMPQNWKTSPYSGAPTIGNPLITGNNQSRPMILNRPFRTVAELGYTFRDTPWKNLDFFSPESGDAPLLDVFCINDTDSSSQLQAGKVNLNTRQEPVITAILAGAYKDEEAGFSPAAAGVTVATPLSATEAANVAKYAFTPWRNSTMAPAQNLAGFISQWGTKTMAPNFNDETTQTGNPVQSHMPAGKAYGIDGASSYSGFSNEMATERGTNPSSATLYPTGVFTTNSTQSVFPSSTDLSWNVQRLREAPTRALTAVGQTRTWNLMIDLIAQTGRYPVSANSLNNFSVEGEQRYWIHLAIDRYTGKVVDKQVEIVKE